MTLLSFEFYFTHQCVCIIYRVGTFNRTMEARKCQPTTFARSSNILFESWQSTKNVTSSLRQTICVSKPKTSFNHPEHYLQKTDRLRVRAPMSVSQRTFWPLKINKFTSSQNDAEYGRAYKMSTQHVLYSATDQLESTESVAMTTAIRKLPPAAP